MRHATVVCALIISIGLLIGGCGDSGDSKESTSTNVAAPARTTTAPVELGVKPTVVVPPGPPPEQLVVNDLLEGEGPPARSGHDLTVQFVALRWNGEPFQSSWDSGKVEPFTFELHNSLPQVIPGWERGLPGIQSGGRRELVVPPKFIYRPGQNTPGPPDPSDTLVYVVEALKVD